ncbi:MAG: 16S rRNA (guanine(966)-N(2))-methyltransferase RsmD [Thermoleophilia bacterium]|nr:16S rRNA (guanine(966)-N(2))-methyltransferase RsmD [Thermoleophilia bacterium]
MRVVAGEFGGRRLIAPTGASTRPTSDRVRESLFQILGTLDGHRVLDLFAGSGALGIEALSRGAATLVAVDDDRGAVEAILANVSVLGLGERVRVVRRGWRAALEADAQAGATYDLVLADPPYAILPVIADELWPRICAVLVPGGTIVLEHARGAIIPRDGTHVVGVEREITRRYGDTEITVIWTLGEGT